jgi:uncharacterized protein
MRWGDGGISGDIEDRRGQGGGGGGFGFGGGRGLGLGGILILGLLSLFFGRDLISPFLGLSRGVGTAPSRESAPDPSRMAREEKLTRFVSFVIDDLQKMWTTTLPQQTGIQYQRTKLVLFWDATQSTCGFAESASGPFYCPSDEKVFIDLGFYDELKQQFGAPGEFAQAYVIAHEVGHHIQKLTGVEQRVRALQSRNPTQANPASVRMELQADCLAGVWGNSAAKRHIIDEKDVEAGLNAAASIGDDRIQKMSTGRVFPEKFTHGSSAQRVEWFRRGLSEGSVKACNTFSE